MKKNLFLLNAFLCILLNIFIQLLILQDHYCQLAIEKFSDHRQVMVYCFAIFCIFFLWILSIYFFYKFNAYFNQEKISIETDRLQLEESQKLIQTLRSQGHDFRNQLQVIRILAQLNKNSEIAKYIEGCDLSLEVPDTISSQIENPVISAMMLFFFAQAKEKEISFNIDSDLDFSTSSLPLTKITRILGNVIRNAIEILATTTSVERTIQVTIWETNDYNYFIIWNNGPVIPDDIKEKIFDEGFSAKNSTGFGLAIVKKLVRELSGTIQFVSSQEYGTEFKIIIPKNISFNHLSQ